MAKRATSLGPRSSLVFCFFVLIICFPLCASTRKETCFPPNKGNFCLFFYVSLCFSLAVFWPPRYSFFLSLSFLLFSFFLPVAHVNFWFLLLFLFYWIFVSRCSFVFVFLLVVLFCSESQHYIYISFLHFVFLLLLLFLVFVLVFFEFWRPIKNISQNFGNSENPQNEKCRKKLTFWQEQLAQVCSQIMFFYFCVSLKFAFFVENTKKTKTNLKC